MSIIQILIFILKHPLNKKHKIKSILIFFKWQISQFLLNMPLIYSFTKKTKLILKKGQTGGTGNLYLGLMEFPEMAFLLHLVRENDLFVDVGANIGSYTILASAENGARTISIEPIPDTYLSLIDNINLNKISDKVKALNLGIASKKGQLRFTEKLDSINHVTNDSLIEGIDVEVLPLDTILKNENPILIKIDVEGYESEVINGANSVLKNPELRAIIIELAGIGRRYGFDDNLIHDELLRNNFNPYIYDPYNRKIIKVATMGQENTIYIRDENFISERLKSAPYKYIGIFSDII